MNILLTGATGFVGRHLIPKLVEDDHEILCIVHDKNKFILHDGVIVSEITDTEKIKSYKPNIAIHLASFLSSRSDEDTLNKILDANIVFGTRLLNTINAEDLKLFVNFGSFAEYRRGPEYPDAANPYGATKTAFRKILDYYSSKDQYNYIHVVPYTIYGGEDTQKKLIDYIKDSVDSIEPVKMSPGNQVMDFIHVDDVVSFILYVINHVDLFDQRNGETFHLGSGEGRTPRQIASIIEMKYNTKCNIEWGGLSYRERDVMYAVAPIAKIKEIGWEPHYKLENSL